MPRNWTAHELLIAMNVYCKLPFGKLSQSDPLIIRVAEKMGRTPSSVSMKLCNFASFDSTLQARGIRGLTGASRADRVMWDAFHADWNQMSDDSEAAFEELIGNEDVEAAASPPISPPQGPSEGKSMVTVRRHQRFFRNTVLASYEHRCALSRIAITQLLNASHIIPWKDNEARRTDPTNGLCLHVLYDRAFDRGLITFDEDNRLVVSPLLKSGHVPDLQRMNFAGQEGTALHLPHRFTPDPSAMAKHRNSIFKG
ncbi:MAG: HNH endonuclease [Lentisphaerae bacterium]|nr:HNH endonuclease [Lentisphaerota bacterium]